MKQTVLVGRKWDNPNIEVRICEKEIGIEMEMKDFLHALAEEAGNPTFMMTVSGLEKRLKDAAENVISGMKSETARVI